jgi:hypothetical protein
VNIGVGIVALHSVEYFRHGFGIERIQYFGAVNLHRSNAISRIGTNNIIVLHSENNGGEKEMKLTTKLWCKRD